MWKNETPNDWRLNIMENEVKKPRKKMSRKHSKEFDRCIGYGCIRCSDMLGCNPANPMYKRSEK